MERQAIVMRNHTPIAILAVGTTEDQARAYCEQAKKDWCETNGIKFNCGRFNYQWHWMPVIAPVDAVEETG